MLPSAINHTNKSNFTFNFKFKHRKWYKKGNNFSEYTVILKGKKLDVEKVIANSFAKSCVHDNRNKKWKTITSSRCSVSSSTFTCTGVRRF